MPSSKLLLDACSSLKLSFLALTGRGSGCQAGPRDCPPDSCPRRGGLPVWGPSLPGLLRDEPLQPRQLEHGAEQHGHGLPLLRRLLPAPLLPAGEREEFRQPQQELYLPPHPPLSPRHGLPGQHKHLTAVFPLIITYYASRPLVEKSNNCQCL